MNPTDKKSQIENITGSLYGDLWSRQQEDNFKLLVSLSEKYVQLNRQDIDGKICLDAGCGVGFFVKRLLSFNPKKVYAIDLSDECVQLTKEWNKDDEEKIFVKQGNILNLPFDNNFFDFVHSNGVLPCIVNFEKGLDELIRVLKPNGTLVIGLYGSGGLFNFFLAILRIIVKLLPYRFVNLVISFLFKDYYKQYLTLDLLTVPIRKTYSIQEMTGVLAKKNIQITNIVNTYGAGFINIKRLLQKMVFGQGYIYITGMKIEQQIGFGE